MCISTLRKRLAALCMDAAGRRQHAVCLSLCAAAAILAGAILLPVSAPRAAIGDESSTAPNAIAPSNPTNFGEATPSDKFVQSFQQQVSQQLQSALTQSGEAQEARFHEFEQHERELAEQVRALEQSLSSSTHPAANAATRRATADVGIPDGSEAEAPRVNMRRSGGSGDSGDGSPSGGAGFFSTWSGLSNIGSPDTASIANSGREFASSTHEDASMLATAVPAPRLRPGDANIAPHGFVAGRLLNGVVTVQGGAERESVVALSGKYQSANGYQADLAGCFALVQGRPEIATGRIDFKLSRLTCNFADGASRTWDASGWLVDADGIRGVRATIVDNTARKAGVAAAGGAIGGIGQRISQQQYQINSSALGLGTNSTFAGDVGRDALGGGASGAANALGQSIADYYNLYSPSLQVGGGTRVTVVLANDLRVPPSGREITQTHSAQP